MLNFTNIPLDFIGIPYFIRLKDLGTFPTVNLIKIAFRGEKTIPN